MSFTKQTASPEARHDHRVAKYPRPAQIDHNRQDAKRLQRAARHKSGEKSGTALNSVSRNSSSVAVSASPTCWKAVPGHVHCRPDRGSGNAPEHDHDARREKHVPCASQKTILFSKHPSNRLRDTNKLAQSPLKRGSTPACARSSHFRESHEIPRDIQCFAANLYTESQCDSSK